MANRAKRWRKKTQKTVKQCAEMAGVTPRQWYRWEASGEMPEHRELQFRVALNREDKQRRGEL